MIPAGFVAEVPLDENLHINGKWGANQALTDTDASTLQVLRRVPQGVLNYLPDVPTPDEVNLLGALDPQVVRALEPHVLRLMVRRLMLEGADAATLARRNGVGLRRYLLAHEYQLSAADRATFPDGFYENLLQSLETANSGGASGSFSCRGTIYRAPTIVHPTL